MYMNIFWFWKEMNHRIIEMAEQLNEDSYDMIADLFLQRVRHCT